MSQGAEADPPPPGNAELDLLLGASRAWLGRQGECITGSGSFRTGQLSLSMHSDFGPADQDKTTNQDYALAWRPEVAGNRMRLVLALADGLTNSYRSECAAAAACWVAVRALVEADAESAPPQELARLAFNEAGLAIGRLADDLARDPETSCPEGQFPSTWKYILKKGGLFQTTLTLAWLDASHFHLATVGDGGALWRSNGEASASRNDQVLAACNLESQEVFALGPADRCVREFDSWREVEAEGPFLCALVTDGVGRGIGGSPAGFLDELERLHAAGEANPARRYIEEAIRRRPKDFHDNMTLAVLRVE